MLRTAVLLAALPLMASCSTLAPPGDLEPGCTEGICVIVEGPRPPDGRDMAIGDPQPNRSMTEAATLISVQLIDAVGLELVEAFTASMDHQITGPVPPMPGDPGYDESMANWAMRAPLAGSVVPPDDVLMVVLVLRPTLAGQCVYTKGYRLTYTQANRQHSADKNIAVVMYPGDDGSVCEDIVTYLQQHPADPPR